MAYLQPVFNVKKIFATFVQHVYFTCNSGIIQVFMLDFVISLCSSEQFVYYHSVSGSLFTWVQFSVQAKVIRLY